MATVQQVISRALGKLGVLGAGATPATADNTRALEALQAVYRALITDGAFGELYDVIPTDTIYTARENERIFRNSGTVTEVILPDVISQVDCFQEYGREVFADNDTMIRPPRDGAVVVIIDAFTQTPTDWIYDGQIKRWIDISELTYSATAPHSFRDVNGLAALLAENLADEFGLPLTATIAKHAADYKLGLVQNFSEAGEILMPGNYI